MKKIDTNLKRKSFIRQNPFFTLYVVLLVSSMIIFFYGAILYSTFLTMAGFTLLSFFMTIFVIYIYREMVKHEEDRFLSSFVGLVGSFSALVMAWLLYHRFYDVSGKFERYMVSILIGSIFFTGLGALIVTIFTKPENIKK